MTNLNRMLLALVARGGVMLDAAPTGHRHVRSAAPDGSRLAAGIHRDLLELVDARYLDVGIHGHLRLTALGSSVLRG